MLDSVVVICVVALLDFGSVSGSGIVFGSGTVSGSELVSGSGSGSIVFGSVQLSSSLLSRQSDIPSHRQLSGMQGPRCGEGGGPPWTDSWASPGSPSTHSNSASEHLHQCRY